MTPDDLSLNAKKIFDDPTSIILFYKSQRAWSNFLIIRLEEAWRVGA